MGGQGVHPDGPGERFDMRGLGVIQLLEVVEMDPLEPYPRNGVGLSGVEVKGGGGYMHVL